jgi:endonuclease G
MSQEESLNRLESMRARSPRMFDAAAKAVAEGRFNVARLGMPRENVLKALSGQRSGLESMAAVLSPIGLEAIVRRIGRPPLVVRGGKVVLEPLEDFPDDIDAKISDAERIVSSVGRIEFVNHSMAWGGTGWVVDKKDDGYLVLTNRHVAKIVAKRTADGKAVFLRSPVTGVRYGAQIDFNEEADATASDARVAQAIEIAYLADDIAADMALLKVKKPGDAAWAMPDPVPLAAQEASKDELVALIGYPAFDSRNDRTAMDEYFRDLYDVKRFAPGRVMARQAGAILSHDCTSLGGNSGSPLISLEQKGAVGLHFAGVYGVENSAVSVTTIKQLLSDSLPTVSAGVSAATTEAADGSHGAEDLTDRGGFDVAFLGAGFETPWPKPTADIAQALATPSDATEDRPHELRYTHFGVLFSAEFKLPVIAAVNVDGENSVRIKRGADKWFFDGRIDRKIQHGQRAYQDDSIDRGHMVRREDPNWGDDAVLANDDTFHYTNAAPQHSALNQGKTLWQGLENYILNSSRTHGFKANVFTAPVYSDDDPVLEEEGVRVPMEFWKVVTMIDADQSRLHVTAYLLSQGQLIRKLLEDRVRSEAVEGFVLGEYRTFQLSLKDLESGTGYDFGILKNFDPLSKQANEREIVGNRLPVVVAIETPQDLVL